MRTWLALTASLVAMQAASGAERDSSPVATRKSRQISSPISDRFSLRSTYFAPSVVTDLRLDAQDGTPGTELSAEEDLGLDDRLDQGRIELIFRLRERSRMRVDYFKVDRFSDTVLARTIDFGDETFDVSDRVLATLDWRMLGFTYTYSPLRFDRFELGVGLGIHLLEAEAIGDVPAQFEREEASGVGAFPTIALDATWRISRRFALSARGQHFSASVDEFDGSLSDYHIDLQYRWRRNFAVGLGYSVIRAKLEVSDADFPGRFALDVDGPELFLRVSF